MQLDVPGVPAFIKRMARGHTTTERKCLLPGQTVAALPAPGPKALCRVDQVAIASGRYTQTLTCPQKQGRPMTVARSGKYYANGFNGRATVTSSTNKGPMNIILDQQASHSGGACSS